MQLIFFVMGSSSVGRVMNMNKLPTDVSPASPELDGARKAFALYNEGLITVEEISEYASQLSSKEREKVVKEKTRALADVASRRSKEAPLEAATFRSLAATSNAAEFVAKGLWLALGAAGNAASKAALEAASKAAHTAVESAKRGVRDLADGAVEATIRAPIRNARIAAVDAATSPFRNAADAVRRLPSDVAESIRKETEAVVEDVLATPAKARKAGEVAAKLAAGAAGLAAESLADGLRRRPREVVVVQDVVVETTTEEEEEEEEEPPVVVEVVDVDVIKAIVAEAAAAAFAKALDAARDAARELATRAKAAASDAVVEKRARAKAIAAKKERLDVAADRLERTREKAKEIAAELMPTPKDGTSVASDLADRADRAREEREKRLPAVAASLPLARSVVPGKLPAPPPLDARRAATVAEARVKEPASVDAQNLRNREALLRDEIFRQTAAQSEQKRAAAAPESSSS